MFLNKSIYPIGIDLSEAHLYAVQLQDHRKGLSVRGLFHQELEAADGELSLKEESLSKALKEIPKTPGFSGRRVALHLPFDTLLSFPIRFQINRESSLEQAIVQKSKEYLPFPLHQAVMDYASLEALGPPEEKRYRAMVVALKKDILDLYLNLVKQCGFVVETVDFAFSSLMRVHCYLYGTIDHPLILCHVGEEQSILSAVNNEGILYQRNISWGLKPLLRRILGNFELGDDLEKGKVLLSRYGLSYEVQRSGAKKDEDPSAYDMQRALFQVITPNIGALVEEIHKIIGYLRSEAPDTSPAGIHLYGQGAFIRHLDTFIETGVNIPTQLINPFEQMSKSNGQGDADEFGGASFCLALGLAMRKVTWL
ncbi:MAG: pilus assembly protein PilM [Pseudomonadota bacterium]